MMGGVRSTTVTVVVQGALTFPAASVAVNVSVCVPRPRSVVAEGTCVTTTGAALFSETTTRARKSTVAVQLVPAVTVDGAGQVITGAMASAPTRNASSMLSEKMVLVPTGWPL